MGFMDFELEGPVVEWRGPAPFFWMFSPWVPFTPLTIFLDVRNVAGRGRTPFRGRPRLGACGEGVQLWECRLSPRCWSPAVPAAPAAMRTASWVWCDPPPVATRCGFGLGSVKAWV